MSSSAAAGPRRGAACCSSSRRRRAPGKTTLVERLVQDVPGPQMSRSYTSRTARPGETERGRL